MTSRRLAAENFLKQAERVAAAGVQGIILREKDLQEDAYERLAEEVQRICAKYGVPLILHTYPGAAVRLGISRLHLPLRVFLGLKTEEKKKYEVLGVSVHSVEEALEAEAAGASCLTAGHIFATGCKAGLAPRGLPFLREVCGSVQIPVYAIGGIGPGNAASCIRAGAAGVCLMSSLMETEQVEEYIGRFRDATAG